MKNFKSDIKNLTKLENNAYELQKDFNAVAAAINKGYKGRIFKCKNDDTEWAFYHCDGYHHSFSFEFYAVSKKNPNLTIRKIKYIHLEKFSLMQPTGRSLPENEKNFQGYY